MNLLAYQKHKHAQQQLLVRRGRCGTCLQPDFACYCAHVQSFDPRIVFGILIHHRETQKRLATGRMAHLCLQNSLLLKGYNYSAHLGINSLLQNPEHYPVVLYPGKQSVNLSKLTLTERQTLFPREKKLCLLVVDGTWSLARKTLRDSTNLQELPQVCFDPPRPSRFRVREQPQANFCATIEAIHECIELLGPLVGFPVESRQHDHLLEIFARLVDQQLDLRAQHARLPDHRIRPSAFNQSKVCLSASSTGRAE